MAATNNSSTPNNEPHLNGAAAPTSTDTTQNAPSHSSSKADELSITQPQKIPTGLMSWWTLRNKATLLAVALGTIPVLIVGGISTSIAGKQLSSEAISQQQQFTNAIALQLQDFGSSNQTAENLQTSAGGSLSEKILNYTEINNLSDLVNQRINRLREGTDSEDNALRFNVVDERRNRVLISNNQNDIDTTIDTLFPEYTQLRESETAAIRKAVSTVDNKPYLLTYTPVQNTGRLDNDLGVLVYQPIAEVFAAQQNLVITLLGGTILTALLVSALAAYLANRATQPIIEASRAVEKLGQGKFETRLPTLGNDELGVLNSNINVMAEQLEYQLEFIQETAQRQGLFQTQAVIAQQQQQKREALQQNLTSLIQSVESVTRGNLTVRANPVEGEVGVLASVINQIIDSLQKIVVEAKQTTWQVNTAISSNQAAIQQLSEDAIAQTYEISQALTALSGLSTLLQTATANAKHAEKVSQQTSSLAGKSTQVIMQAVHNVATWRESVAETSQKVKQLGTASQQISQVVSLINEISLKTNLLAINASIDTKQGPQKEQSLTTVTSEISQLSEQSTRATQEIERIAKGIQSDAKEIVSDMDSTVSQVVEGTSGLHETQNNISQVLKGATTVEELVRSLTEAAAEQVNHTKAIVEQLKQISATSQQASGTAKQTENALQNTMEASQTLALSVDAFQVDS